MPEFSSSGALTTVVVVAIVVAAPVVGVVAFSGTASGVGPSTYAVAQSLTCTEVDPVTNTSQNVTEFYDYRNPSRYDNGNPNSSEFSSFGTTEHQKSEASTIIFYEGSESGSAVFLHDQLGDEVGGSTLTFEFSGLSGGEWVVQDDDYEGQDDEWLLGGDSATIHWMWGENRTDGGAFSGFENLGGPVVVDPGFNEDATYWGEWGHSGTEEFELNGWSVQDADGTETPLDMNRRVFIHSGGCVDAETVASVDAPDSTETGESVTIDATATTTEEDIGGFEWDFDGDGDVDTVTTDPTVDRTFENAGNHTVSVTAFDTYGNPDTASTTVEVTQPSTPPEAALDAPGTVDVNETVEFDARNSTDEGSITEYRWDFDGDGAIDSTTTDPVEEHEYTEPGDVTASVTVVDDSGETDDATAEVSVLPPNQPPNASLTAPNSTPEGESVTLDASESDDDRGIESYEWDVNGDGTVDEETEDSTLDHTYENPGNVTASVTVVDADGATDEASAEIAVQDVDDPPTANLDAPEPVFVNETVTLDAGNSTDDNGIATYRWDVNGNGTVDQTTTEPTLEHTYTETEVFEPEVTVVDTGGNESSASTTIEVLAPDDPPSAALSGPPNATVGTAVAFDASNSSDDNDIDSYRWDFDGDDTVDDETSSASVEHTYETAGTYDASVTVVDTAGQTATATVTVPVTGPPTANLDVPAEVYVNESITLDASGSSDDGSITEYRWDVDGDGSIEQNTTEPTIEHEYTDPGSVTPTVTVVDDDGLTANADASVTVDEPPAPNATFDVTTDDPTAGEGVSFDASASTPGDDVAQYGWDFGDGGIATGPTPSHMYDSEGTYNVTLTVQTTVGATATVSNTIGVAARSSGGGGSGGGGSGGSGGGGSGGGGGGSGGGGSGGSGGGGGGSGGGGSGGAGTGGGGNSGGGGGGGSGSGSGSSGGDGGSDTAGGEPSIGPANVTLDRQTLLVGDALVVEAAVTNTGDGPGTKTVEFEVEDTIVEEREIPLDPNETRTVTFTHEFTDPGEKTIRVDYGEKRYVTVEPREPDVSVRSVNGVDRPVAAGEAFTLTAIVENTGHASGTETVELELFGEVVAVENVSVPAGETQRVEFTRSIQAPGTYDAAVGNASVTIQVDGGENATTTLAGSDSSGGTIPGFGVAVAVLALLVTALVAARRSG